jgi:hypothetical protein
MSRIYGAKDQKLYTDEVRLRQIRRKLYLSDSYQEFQNAVLFCTMLAIHEVGGKPEWYFPLSEIKRLANIDLSNPVAVGKVFKQYVSDKKADKYAKKEAVENIKEGARLDMLILELLVRNGIDDIEKFWWDEKYPPVRKPKQQTLL